MNAAEFSVMSGGEPATLTADGAGSRSPPMQAEGSPPGAQCARCLGTKSGALC